MNLRAAYPDAGRPDAGRPDADRPDADRSEWGRLAGASLLAAWAGAAPGVAQAESVAARIAIRFQGFPAPLDCEAHGAAGDVRFEMRGGLPTMIIHGDAGDVDCITPNNELFRTTFWDDLREGADRIVVTLRPDGNGEMISSGPGGLYDDKLTGAIEMLGTSTHSH